MPPDKLQIVVLVENSVYTGGLLAEHGLSLLLEWGSHRVLFDTTPGCREVVPGFFVTGAVPRGTSYEDVGGRFFVDPELQQSDGLADDQAIFVPTSQGTVVVLGCAHAGVINTLRHIQRLTGESRFRAVLGGMHLVHASEARLEATLRDLGEWDIPLLVPGHCTGVAATARLWTTFAGRCAGLGVGSRLLFD